MQSNQYNQRGPGQPVTRKNQNNKRKKNRRRNNVKASNRGVHLSDCAMAYAVAQLDPFNSALKVMQPCIPDAAELSSFKFSVTHKGFLQIGSNRTGFLAANPLCRYSDKAIAMITNSLYTGDMTTPLPPGAAVTTGVSKVLFAKSPFTSTTPRSGRCVGFGARVRYVGTELNRGGNIIKISSSTNNSAQGYSLVDLSAQQEVSLDVVDRKWHTVAFRPTANGYSEVVQDVVNGYAIVLGVSGEPGNEFEYELIGHYEVVSTPAAPAPSVSRSDTDIVGISVVRDFVGSLISSDAGTAIVDQFKTYLKQGASMALSSIMPGSGPVVKALMY